ncbi:hypothetical protein PRVXT_000348 [Proteinivorax tanatarense]|uniref:Uncharacterized protein n=1 Tax=Proteinivorax tanatarense TaxID=1260629 RepID=A0AAU7VN92_9FIRM
MTIKRRRTKVRLPSFFKMGTLTDFFRRWATKERYLSTYVKLETIKNVLGKSKKGLEILWEHF